ncbi:MAG: hypothetical protein M3380_05535 [Chloroflexota bacterium]|nr:hypothetical protein [Chloroflexota bacterium]
MTDLPLKTALFITDVGALDARTVTDRCTRLRIASSCFRNCACKAVVMGW